MLRRVTGRIHGAIVAVTGRSDRRGDRRGDDHPVYTLQATGCRDDRQLVARLNMFT